MVVYLVSSILYRLLIRKSLIEFIPNASSDLSSFSAEVSSAGGGRGTWVIVFFLQY